MLQRKLGLQGLVVPSLGLGCMGMSWGYGQADEKESMKVLQRSVALGMNFWDTAELYGPYKNEELLGKALQTIPRDKVIIATKFAFKFRPDGEIAELDSSPKHIKKTIEGSLKRLKTDYIDLYYQHRLDPKTPIEDTVQAMADLVKEGKVRYIGLSEVSPTTIRRAHQVHPVSAIQSEYSLWERGVEDDVLPTLRELGIGFVAYSPMGRGFLSGQITKLEDLEPDDRRRTQPRFQGENFQLNFELVDKVKEIAEKYKATPAQIALAWLLNQGNDIVAIPGTKHIPYLEENAKTIELKLPESAWSTLNKILSDFQIAGTRYPESTMKLIDK